MNADMQPAPFDPATSIRGETGSKLRVFLHELAEGVTGYRTVHSLTEQVQHQYHGRFAIELIQNAYDALSRDPHIATSHGRIEMRLIMDREVGTLYVANDGAPFSESNFRSVSRLGQSDKSPEVSIGNKGIGFRSVLEISRHPKIWSRRSARSHGFDGYCFGFAPELVSSIHAPIVALLSGQQIPSGNEWLHDLVVRDQSWLDRLRAGINRQAAEEGQTAEAWLQSQIGYLSPYLLPWPLDGQEQPDAVVDFEERGFSTVLALPLISASSARLVDQKLSALDEASVLFLDNLKSLTLSTRDETRTFSRSRIRIQAGQRRFGEIAIGSETQPMRFRIWSRELLVSDMPGEIRASVAALPGHWPSLRKAEITLAVGSHDASCPGRLSIFLPTKLETGANLHINAPFFGDMSRTSISFAEDADDLQAGGPYNSFLLSQAADLALEAIASDLQGGTAQDAADILDILAPVSTDAEAAKRWKACIRAAAFDKAINIPGSAWMLSDRGWTTLAETSLLPLADNPQVLGEDLVRQHATFPAYVKELDGRAEQIRCLSDDHGIGILPSPEDQAGTIENLAKALLATEDVDWKGFWEDVCEILDDDLSELRHKEVLLCMDGALHAGGVEGRAIYFRPRLSVEEENNTDEQGIDQIPEALRPFIAILDPAIPITEVSGGRRQNTKLHKLLVDAGLVDQFRREEVLTDVLIPNLPATPVLHRSAEVALCRDALVYSLRLAQSMEVRGDGQGLLKALAKLPVPCRGGWFALSTAIFGAGWSRTNGQIVSNYLRLAKSASTRAVQDRLLRSPEHPDWGGLGATVANILLDAGVNDGLPLLEIGGKESAFTLESWNYRFSLAAVGPSPIDDQTWREFRSNVSKLTSNYKAGKYKAEKIYWLPGLEAYAEFDQAAREAFFGVVLHSASLWPSSWGKTALIRTTGTYEVKEVASPLMVALRIIDWIPGPSEGWSRPSERWFVPSRHIARGRAWTLEHLLPLPPEISAMVEQGVGLADVLKSIGIPFYEPDRETDDPRLLNCLADTARSNSYRNKDVFVGHLRTAWDAFAPAASASFPTAIVVQQPDGHLAAFLPTESTPVYLPGDRNPATALRDLGLPVVVIEPRSARRLSDAFSAAYGRGLRSSEQFEMTALTGDIAWNGDDTSLLGNFAALDGVAPFLLTIAAYHGSNAQGTASNSFNDLVRALRESRVALVPDLSIVPMMGDEQIAAPRRQTAAWLPRRRILILDSEWGTDIEAVADAFTHLIGRSDLRFQNRKGLSEIWGKDDVEALEGILRQMDLTVEHYRGVLELWREELGPLIERLSILMRILGRPDLASRLQKAEQRDQILPLLRYGLSSDVDADFVLQSAIISRDIFQFGCDLRNTFGARTELSAWNRELVIRGDTELLNPAAEIQFLRHKGQALPALRRIVSTLSSRSADTPSYSEAMQKIDTLRCGVEVARNYWEVPLAEVARAVSEMLISAGFPDDLSAIIGEISVDGRLPETALSQYGIVETDPVEVGALNRRNVGTVLDQVKLVFAAWYARSGRDKDTSWIPGFTQDPGTSQSFVDRDLYTITWDEGRCLGFIAASLPYVAPQELRSALEQERTVEGISTALGILSEELQGAEKKLAAAQAENAQRKRMVDVCGAEMENSEAGLSGLFAHILAGISQENLGALAGFDLGSALVPKAFKRSACDAQRKAGARTKAPKRSGRKMEDIVGAAGEIHAYRWLQLRYGSEMITPSNWVSAYSAHAFPDNAMNVDEGRGCDLVFTVDGSTYEIEIKSSEGEASNFILGTSEIRRARDLATKSRRRPRTEYLILKVDRALSTEPVFTLLPNPYDPKYKDRFDIVDDGARVTYRL